jgi:four helix bundle protein
MATLKRFEDIDAWKEARELTKAVYQITSVGEFARDYRLRDQIRRATISIMSNIAEGFERGGDKEFLRFLSIAKGSCGEIRAQLYAAFDQAYMSEAQFQDLIEKVITISRLLAGLMKYLQASPLRGSKFK